MDSQRFRKQTSPNYAPSVSNSVTEQAVKRAEAEQKTTAPIEDQRYPHYAAKMEDARLVTDYKSHCAANTAPSQYGNSMRAWFQHHADALVQVSRKRQADRAGAQFSKAPTVPPARQLQQCSPYECTFLKNKEANSIGLERVEGVPPLFGTFSEARYSMPESGAYLTTEYEGGRNTPRGQVYRPLGTTPVFPSYPYNYN
jgi:hypothetical protein